MILMGAVPARTLVRITRRPPDVLASEDFRANGHGGPVTSLLPVPARGLRWSRCPRKSLRRAALDARKAFVRTLSDADRTLLEQRLAQHLTSLCAEAKVVGGYSPTGFGDQSAARDRGSPRGRRGSSPFPPSTIPPSRSASAPATRSSPVRSESCSRAQRHRSSSPT